MNVSLQHKISIFKKILYSCAEYIYFGYVYLIQNYEHRHLEYTYVMDIMEANNKRKAQDKGSSLYNLN